MSREGSKDSKRIGYFVLVTVNVVHLLIFSSHAPVNKLKSSKIRIRMSINSKGSLRAKQDYLL